MYAGRGFRNALMEQCGAADLKNRAIYMKERMLDLRNNVWMTAIGTSTGGMLPKTVAGNRYIKMSAYNQAHGVYGNEAVFEVLASRIAENLGVDCVKYELADALVYRDGKEFVTEVCVSEDFRKGRETVPFEKFYSLNKLHGETTVELINRFGLTDAIHKMMVFDFIICNLDRHGKNVELFTEPIEVAPLFDNSFSLLGKIPESGIMTAKFNDDISVNNFIGERNLLANLKYVAATKPVRLNRPESANLPELLSKERMDTIRRIAEGRYRYARDIQAIV
jgi:hypothetical protein